MDTEHQHWRHRYGVTKVAKRIFGFARAKSCGVIDAYPSNFLAILAECPLGSLLLYRPHISSSSLNQVQVTHASESDAREGGHRNAAASGQSHSSRYRPSDPRRKRRRCE